MECDVTFHHAFIAQLVERILGKDEVPSSNLGGGSITPDSGRSRGGKEPSRQSNYGDVKVSTGRGRHEERG